MTCIGHEYDDYLHRKRHLCSGPSSWNHILINKRKFQGVKVNRRYFDKMMNGDWCCQWFHNSEGETTAFRAWFKDRQIFLYGRVAVKAFFENSPQKIKERL